MNNTTIEWTKKTWNPITGCTKYSAGCANCYAEVISRRFSKAFPNGFNVTLHPERLNEPKKVTNPTMFFVCSMADLFHEKVPFDYIDRVMQTITECHQHTFQILTKRPLRMYDYFFHRDNNIPKNVWLGTSVENKETKGRINYLCEKYATVRFLSCEPLLGDLGKLDLRDIDWVIVGGESGPKARPMKKEWVLNIQRQCKEQGVPFFFKQWGTYGEDGIKRSKKANGHTIDGITYQAFPKIH